MLNEYAEKLLDEGVLKVNMVMSGKSHSNGMPIWNVLASMQDGQKMQSTYYGPVTEPEKMQRLWLDAVLDETSTFRNASCFEDWCDELCYDIEDRNLHAREYRAVEKQAKALEKLLGETCLEKCLYGGADDEEDVPRCR